MVESLDVDPEGMAAIKWISQDVVLYKEERMCLPPNFEQPTVEIRRSNSRGEKSIRLPGLSASE